MEVLLTCSQVAVCFCRIMSQAAQHGGQALKTLPFRKAAVVLTVCVYILLVRSCKPSRYILFQLREDDQLQAVELIRKFVLSSKLASMKRLCFEAVRARLTGGNCTRQPVLDTSPWHSTRSCSLIL